MQVLVLVVAEPRAASDVRRRHGHRHVLPVDGRLARRRALPRDLRLPAGERTTSMPRAFARGSARGLEREPGPGPRAASPLREDFLVAFVNALQPVPSSSARRSGRAFATRGCCARSHCADGVRPRSTPCRRRSPLAPPRRADVTTRLHERSSSATLARRLTEILRGLDCVQRIPAPRTTAERRADVGRPVNEPARIGVLRRATARQPRREAVDVRRPSECRRPRRNSRGNASTISRCQGSSTIGRSCLRPGPCCGNASGQRLLSPTTCAHGARDRSCARTRRGSPSEHRRAARLDGAGYAPRCITSRHVRGTPPRAHRRDRGRGDRCTTGRSSDAGPLQNVCSLQCGRISPRRQDSDLASLVSTDWSLRLRDSPNRRHRSPDPPVGRATSRRRGSAAPRGGAATRGDGVAPRPDPFARAGPLPAGAAMHQRRGGSTSTSFPGSASARWHRPSRSARTCSDRVLQCLMSTPRICMSSSFPFCPCTRTIGADDRRDRVHGLREQRYSTDV